MGPEPPEIIPSPYQVITFLEITHSTHFINHPWSLGLWVVSFGIQSLPKSALLLLFLCCAQYIDNVHAIIIKSLFTPNPDNRHPLAHLVGHGMGCQLGVSTLIYNVSVTAVLYEMTCYIVDLHTKNLDSVVCVHSTCVLDIYWPRVCSIIKAVKLIASMDSMYD